MKEFVSSPKLIYNSSKLIIYFINIQGSIKVAIRTALKATIVVFEAELKR